MLERQGSYDQGSGPLLGSNSGVEKGAWGLGMSLFISSINSFSSLECKV